MDSDIVRIYEQLRERYSIVLNHSLEMNSKFTIDFPILCGTSSLGKFKVFFDGVSFPFYATHEDGKIFAHWHLQTVDEVEKTVTEFMEGKTSAIPFEPCIDCS